MLEHYLRKCPAFSRLRLDIFTASNAPTKETLGSWGAKIQFFTKSTELLVKDQLVPSFSTNQPN